MKTLGIIANHGKRRAVPVLRELAVAARAAGLKLCCEEDSAPALRGARVLPLARLVREVDGVMVLGGDGTLLSAVRELRGRPVPLIGVNLGSLGFLTSVAEEALARALQCLATDDFTISRRVVLEAALRRGTRVLARYRALNDVVIHSRSSRVVTLGLRVNGEGVTEYTCDGLIAATPTGSTGYAMSAYGPIVHPNADVLLVTLICPHTLSSRPLVLPGDCILTVEAIEQSGRLAVAADGQVGRFLTAGDAVEIGAAAEPALLVELPGTSYFDVLRRKLGWRGSSVTA